MTTTSVLELTKNIAALKGCKFVSFTYTNTSGEVAKVLVNIGVSYENAKTNDLQKIKDFEPATALEAVAKEQLIKSLTTPDQVRSEAQTASKTYVVENRLFFYNESQEIGIWGNVVSKQIITPGTYKTVKSSDLTITKNHLKKELGFTTVHFRAYKINNIGTIRINGETLELS